MKFSFNLLLLAVFVALVQATANSNCKKKGADIIIAIDTSKEVSRSEFRTLKCRSVNIISHFPVANQEDKVLFSVNTFTNKLIQGFSKTTYTTKSKLVNAVHGLQYNDTQDVPDLEEALTLMTDEANHKTKRKNALLIYIFLVSGVHRTGVLLDNTDFKTERQQRTQMYAISTTRPQRSTTLSRNIHALTGYDVRKSTMRNTNVHDVIKRQLVEHCPDCYDPTMELVFLLDNSNSVSRSTFTKMKTFVGSLTDEFTMGTQTNQVRCAVVTFGTVVHNGRTTFGLDAHTTGSAFKTAVTAIAYNSSNIKTNIGKAMEYSLNNILSQARTGASKMILILTDMDLTSDTVVFHDKKRYELMMDKAERENTVIYHLNFGRSKTVNAKSHANKVCLEGQFPNTSL